MNSKQFRNRRSRSTRVASTLSLATIVIFTLLVGPSLAEGADYTLPVELPTCDESEDDVEIIRDDSDWQSVNDDQIRVFCVTPGDYSGVGVVELTESGSENQRRYLRYWNPSAPNRTTHPVDTQESNRAIVRGFDLDGASYWTIHGITSRAGSDRQNPTNKNVHIQNNSNHNIFDHVLVERGRGTLFDFRSNSDANSLQNSVVRWSVIRPNDDNMCANFSGEDTQDNRIVRSELYDCAGDSIHVSPSGPGDNRGTLIADNDLFITPDLYSDCNGNRTPNGDCACAENAIDVKAIQGGNSTSEPEEHWLKILDNRMWGWRRTDSSCGSTGSSGAIITTHFAPADFMYVKGNIFFDGPLGWTTSAEGVNNVTLASNIFWDLSRRGITMHHKAERVEAYHNTIVDVGNHHSHLARAPSTNEFKCNTAIDAGTPASDNSDARADYNAYFNSEPFQNNANDLEFASASEANAEEFCFERRIWTDPTETCIPHVLETEQSPHRDHCDPNLGSTSGVGVNDTTDPSFFEKDWRNYGGFSARASVEPSSGPAPLEVEFDADPSGDTQPFDFDWNFGDGSSSSERAPTHTYDDPGTYQVTLAVTDDTGATADFSTEIAVADPDELVFSPVPHYGNAANWEPRTPSRWSVEEESGDKRYFLNTSDFEGDGNQPGEFALARDRTFEDFELEFSVKTNEDLSENTGADYVVVFGYRDADNYHFLLGHVQAEFTKLFTVESGERRLVRQFDDPLLPDASWHDVGLERSDNDLTIELDGSQFATATLDANFGGRIGVGSFNESAYFDNIDIASPDGRYADIGVGGDDAGATTGSGGGSSDGGSGTGATPDAGVAADADEDDGPGGFESDEGCNCSSNGRSTPGGSLALLLLAIVGLRTRFSPDDEPTG